MRRILIVLTVFSMAAVYAADFGVVSTADYVRFEIEALDSAGIPVCPDSGHVLVWFEGEATADAASYTNRWINAGAGSVYVDSARYAGHTYYYFVDQIGDIDNDEGQGLYAGVVVLYTDGGLPTANRFTFTLAGDELADYWAEVTRVGDSIDAYDNWVGQQAEITNLDGWNPVNEMVMADTNRSGKELAVMPDHWTAADSTAYQGAAAGLDSTTVARAVWNAPAANHTTAGTFGSYLDTAVSAFLSGSGAFSVTIVAFDSANAQVVAGAKLAVRNLEQSNLLAMVATDGFGRAEVNLDSGSYVVAATAPGYLFDAYDTVVVTGAGSDTVSGVWFNPGTPSQPTLCRVYGFLFTTGGQPESGAKISAWLPSGVTLLDGVIISPAPVTTVSDDTGYFYLDLAPSAHMIGSPAYEISINRSDGTILRKRLKVPDTDFWQLAW